MNNPTTHYFSRQIGAFKCTAVRDGDDWDRNILLVDTGAHRLLIDTGIGDVRPPHALLIDRLRGLGYYALDLADEARRLLARH